MKVTYTYRSNAMRRIVASLALLAVAAEPLCPSAAKPSGTYLNIPLLIDEDVAQVEKVTGHPTRIDRSNDDTGWILREYSLPFGKVKIDYLDSKAASFAIVLKSPERSARALMGRFGIHAARRKPESDERFTKTWDGRFTNHPISEIHVEASHASNWDRIDVRDYSSLNE